MKELFLKFGLFLFSVTLGLVLMEGISRVFLETTHTHVVNQDGEIASMQIDPGNPTAGLVPYFQGRMISGEFDVPISLNSLGFREQIEIGIETDGEPLHITLLGDSFMFGWGVEFSQSYAVGLATRLNGLLRRRIVVTPLAVPGTGQFSQLALLNRTPHPEPDVVLVGMYLADHVASGNDLIENSNECYRLKASSQIASTGTVDIPKPDLFRQIRRWLKNHSNLYRFVETRLGAILLARFSGAISIESDPEAIRKAWSVTDSVLVALREYAEERHALFVIQYVPNMLDVAKDDCATFLELERVCEARNIQLAPNPIDLFNSASTREKLDVGSFYYVGDGHWTVQAHQVAARATAEFLAERIRSTY